MLVRIALCATLLAAPPLLAAPTVEVTSSRVEVDRASNIATDTLFEVGEAALKKEALPLLDEVAKAIVKDGKSSIVIHVHTDDTAPDADRTGAYLIKLSQARADAIRAYLVKRGVPARRLTARGRAAESPLVRNSNDENRRANRRVELIVDPDIRPPVAADLAAYLKAIPGNGDAVVATLQTSMGNLKCTLYADRTPATVANFIGLATGQKAWMDPKTGKIVRKPLYDGLVFHRVIPGFMIQGGDPLGAGTGGPGYQFGDEIHPDLVNLPGTIAMANAGPNTNGSQFFINEVRSTHLDNRHTVFGKCDDVALITKIASVPREANDKPTKPVVIRKITFAKVAAGGPADPYR
jgi:peptidyl-prolyl cis-trans isomerase A (cyclophilin A)